MGTDAHRRPFEFIVRETFLIEGRGLILSPFFSVDSYQFDEKEIVLIETPDGRCFQADADVEIPLVSSTPKVHQAMFVIRATKKADIPVGSRISLLHKSAEQIKINPKG